VSDRGSSLVLAIGAVAVCGLLVSGVAVAVSSSVRTDAALREGRDRRLAVEGVLRRAMAEAAQHSEPCELSPVVGALNGIAVSVERRNSCRLSVDRAEIRLGRRLLLRACPVQLTPVGPIADAVLGGLAGTLVPLDELAVDITVGACTGPPVIEAEVEVSGGDVALRSWVEIEP
jgi:hypothetical protein